MARGKAKPASVRPSLTPDAVTAVEPIAGLAGPGKWLILHYLPTSLFSLKMSSATSTVGKTLLVPTPYAVKLAFVDAAFGIGWKGDVNSLVTDFARVDVRIGVPARATVTHTIVKIRQEPKERKAGQAYVPAVAYREFVHFLGTLRFAFDLGTCTATAAEALVAIGPGVQYIGKRGSFIQYLGVERQPELGADFTQPMDGPNLLVPGGLHISVLDDFGPEANFDALSSYSATPIKREKHRKFVQTVVPLGVVNVGPGFTEYRSEGSKEKV